MRPTFLAGLLSLSLPFHTAAASDSLAGPSEGVAPGAWGATGSLKVARFAHTATLLNDGRVLVAGGCVREGSKQDTVGCLKATASAEIYDPATGGWKPAGNMHESRVGHTAIALPNGKVLVAGGCVDEGMFGSTCANQTNSAELFDPAKDAWTLTGDMKAPRTDLKSVILLAGPAQKCGANCGKIFVVGSRPSPTFRFPDPASAASLLNLISELYDPSTGQWRPAGSFPQDQTTTLANPVYSLERCFTATGLPDGQVLVVGKSSWLYSPTNDRWSATAKPEPIPRICHSADLLKDGKVFLAGGRSEAGTGISDSSVELYDPVTSAGSAGTPPGTPWRPGPPMALARMGHVSTTLSDGKILVMGGAKEALQGPDPKSAELFDPGLKKWQPAGEMVEGRGGFPAFVLRDARPAFTATLLKDGRVLAVGGAQFRPQVVSSQGETILASSEIYTPPGLRIAKLPAGQTGKPGRDGKGGFPLFPAGIGVAALAVLGLGWLALRRVRS